MADRACNRCISKKRRCDHARPVCGTCKKLKLEGECAYPPPQARRGPVAGMSRRAEHRAQQCENALWFLLNLPGVQEAIERVDPDALTKPFTPAPTAKLERAHRNDWWGEHTMRQPADVLGFRDACHELQTELGIPDGPAPAEEGFEYEPAYDPALETYDYERSQHSTPTQNNSSNSNGNRRQAPEEPRGDAQGHEQEQEQAAQSQSSSSQPQPQPPAQPNKRQRSDAPRRRDDSAMRNAMGPSLWQLVTAAIPDDVEESPQANREGPAREWAGAPMWSTPPPMQMPEREEYEGTRRKRRSDIFW